MYTSSKLKILSATSELSLESWMAALDAAVAQFTPPAMLEAKREAAEQLKPILLAQ